MSTKIADIIKPYILGKMVPALLTEHMDFLATGLASKDYDNVSLTSGGNTVEVPYYGELTGDDEVLDCGVGGVARNYPLLIPGKFTE